MNHEQRIDQLFTYCDMMLDRTEEAIEAGNPDQATEFIETSKRAKTHIDELRKEAEA